MERQTDTQLAACPRDGGLILRGRQMNRIETFVDAAFAFSLTLLVISIDEIPQSPVQLVETARDVPAFLLSALLLGLLWLVHVGWSRIYGLQDRISVVLSLALVLLVLIFVYPLKLMLQSGIYYFSDGWVGADIILDDAEWTVADISNMFVFMAAGVICLAFVVAALYLNGLRHSEPLRLNAQEVFLSWKRILFALVVAATAVACLIGAMVLDVGQLRWAYFGYLSLFFTLPLAEGVFRRVYREAD